MAVGIGKGPTLNTPVATELAQEAKLLAQGRSVDLEELSAFADAYAQSAQRARTIYDGRQWSPGTQIRVEIPNFLESGPLRVKERSTKNQLEDRFRRDLGAAGLGLMNLWADGMISEHEIAPLEDLLFRIDRTLEMADEIGMLDRESRPATFGAMDQLMKFRDAAYEQLTKIIAAVSDRDKTTVESMLKDPAPVFREAKVASDADLSGYDRYQPGDFVVTQPDSKPPKLGVVVAREPDGLRIESASPQGIQVFKMLRARVLEKNPFRIGDRFDLEGEQCFVGIPKTGQPNLLSFKDGQLKDLDPEALRLRLLGPPPPDAATQVVSTGGPMKVAIKDGVQMATVDVMKTSAAGGAIFSDAGVGKTVNHDAAMLSTFKDKAGREVIVAGVADQLGDSHVPAAASTAAIEALELAADQVLAGADIDGALDEAMHFADTNAAKALAKTSFTGAIFVKGEDGGLDGKVRHAGDSRLLKFSGTGRLLDQTEEHAAHRILFERLGRVGDLHLVDRVLGSGDMAPGTVDTQEVHLEPGEFAVFITHGTAHANRKSAHNAASTDQPFTRPHTDVTVDHLSALIEAAPDAQAALEAIRAYSRQQVENGDGYDANMSIVVVQAKKA